MQIPHHLRIKQISVRAVVTFVINKGANCLIFLDWPALAFSMRLTLGATIQMPETCADMPTKSETTAVLFYPGYQMLGRGKLRCPETHLPREVSGHIYQR